MMDRLPDRSMALMPLPLYAGLTADEQLRIFQPTPRHSRKVIVSTNIAEASVTLEGIVYVIDCGFVKVSMKGTKKQEKKRPDVWLYRFEPIIPRRVWKHLW